MTDRGRTMELRPMTAADIARVVELAAELDQAPHWPGRVYEEMLETTFPRRIALVAVEQPAGVVVGAIVARFTAPEAELETIAVAARFQRGGIGRRLLDVLCTALKMEEVSQIHLEVRASNGTAIAFYESLGFQEGGRRREYYADPIEDAVLMRKELSLFENS